MVDGEIADPFGSGAHGVDAQAHMGQRVLPVTVAAVLGDDDLGFEGGDDLRDGGVEGAQPVRVARARGQCDIHRRGGRLESADIGGVPGAGEEELPRFVDRDREHSRVVPEERLDTVTVVGVDIEIDDALVSGFEELGDRSGCVVVDAEPAGLARHRVVHSAAEIHRPAIVTGDDSVRGVDAALEQQRRGGVHILEPGNILGADSEPVRILLIEALSGAGLFDGGDVVGVVEAGELGLIDLADGIDVDVVRVEEPEVLGELRCQVEPERVHGVAGTEVVTGHLVVPNDIHIIFGHAHHAIWRSSLAPIPGPPALPW